MHANDHARTTPALLAPFAAFGREFADLVRNPVACVGGVLGSSVFVALAVAAILLGPSTSDADEGDAEDLVMDFIPGELVRRGEKLDPTTIPEKVIIKETRAADDATAPTVTEDDTVLPDPDKDDRADKPPPKIKPIEKPDPNKPDAEDSDRNRPSNTPYDDPATARDLPGDPFGSADGWADMAKDGDPWATAVLAALNGMTVGSYAGLGQDTTFKFQLVVCADGSVDDVRTKQSTGRPDFDGQIRNTIAALKLPKAPPELAKQLAGKCKKIPYEFTWRGKSAHGSVK